MVVAVVAVARAAGLLLHDAARRAPARYRGLTPCHAAVGLRARPPVTVKTASKSIHAFAVSVFLQFSQPVLCRPLATGALRSSRMQ